jgi:hypothetical protein
VAEVEALGGVENLDSDNSVVLSEIQHDVVRKTAVRDLLTSIVETKVE